MFDSYFNCATAVAKPGDTLILSTDRALSTTQVKRIRESLEAPLKGAGVTLLVISEMDVTILQKARG